MSQRGGRTVRQYGGRHRADLRRRGRRPLQDVTGTIPSLRLLGEGFRFAQDNYHAVAPWIRLAIST